MIDERRITEFDYTNHRGETTPRRVYPLDFKHHPKAGWSLQAIDLTHVPGGGTDCAANRVRCFAMEGVSNWRSLLDSTLPASDGEDEQPLALIDYVNHRGERAWRRVRVVKLHHGPGTEWHAGPQWFLHVVDLDRGVERDFAMSGVRGWLAFSIQPEAPPAEEPVAPAEAGRTNALAWCRARAEELAAETGEAHLVFPEGCPGPSAEGPHLPCVMREADAPKGNKSPRERFDPPTKIPAP